MKRLSLVMLAVIISLMTLASGAAYPSSAQNPTSTPTAAATEEVDIQPENPTITPTTPALKPPPSGTKQPTFKAPKSLDELRATYPDLGPFIDKYKDAKVGDIDMTELYEKITTIFNNEGGTGVGTFLVESGLLEKLNIPLSYIDLLTAYDEGGLEAVDKLARERQIINDDDELAGYLTLDSEDSVATETERLTALGVTVYRFNQTSDELEIGIPLAILAQFQTPGRLLAYLTSVADSEHIQGFRPPYVGNVDEMPADGVEGLGAALMGADKWHEAGFTGEGIRVGVLDPGFGGIKDLLGDTLPENVIANFDIDEMDEHPISHGTAVAEVIHSVAPDAELVLAYFDGSSVSSILDALEFLQENDVQILNHSYGGPAGPRDGTWGFAMAYEAYVRETGMLMVQSAGNSRLSHSMFKFNAGENDLHLFGTTDDGDDVYAMPFEARSPSITIVANWNGNWAGKEKDQFNLIVLDSNGDEVAVGNEPKKGKKGDVPIQEVTFEAERGEIYYVLFQHAKGDDDHILDVFVNGGYLAEWASVPSYSVNSPGDAPSLLTVGAVGLEGDELEPYSSEGPTLDDRLKPEISGPTGEATGAYPKGFYGTSGSAPMIAGAAALVLQQNPDMSAAELKAFLMDNIVDLGEEGEDTQFGTGRLQLPEPEGTGENNDDDDDDDDNGKSGENDGPAEATVTDVSAKFGVKVGKQTGLQINTSFDLENFEGDKVVIGAVFFDVNGDSIPSANENYDVNGTIGVAVEFEPSSGDTSFEDVSLFIPNSAFKQVTQKEIVFVIVIIDPSKQGDESLLGSSEAIKLKVSKK